MTPGYAELELDLPEALLQALLKKLQETPAAALSSANTEALPEAQGVYTLHLSQNADPIYVGKTDSDSGLKQRLSRHARKLIGRKNIVPEEVFFKAIRLYVFTAMDLETALIAHYGGVKSVIWNHSGFGSNDPGKERDTTTYKPEHFDTKYPINIEIPLEAEFPVQDTVATYFQIMKDSLPYLFRFERPNPNSKKSFPKDFVDTIVVCPQTPTPKSLIEACLEKLPSGWQATALPSHIICYKNDTRNIKSGFWTEKSR